jgi:hypothetical protein
MPPEQPRPLSYETPPPPARPGFSPLRVIIGVVIVVGSVYLCVYWAFLLKNRI